jgi:peroxiredoxin
MKTKLSIGEDGRILKIYPKVKPAEHAEEILGDLK